MSNCLLVPIHIDALVSDGSPLREQMVDYTLLPYFNDNRVQNDGTAYLSDRIRSKLVFPEHPTANPYNLSLTPGLHLHWALPDALTQGEQQGAELIFPRVPNRWLISRRGGGDSYKDQQWVVESDYFGPLGQGNLENAVSVHMPPNTGDTDSNYRQQPWRYMGRTLTLGEWKSSHRQADYAPALSAIGPLNHTHTLDTEKTSFAAFYPNCHSVFGFCDAEITPGTTLTADLHYDVIGWYSNPAQDYLLNWFSQWQQTWDASVKHRQEQADIAALTTYQAAEKYKLLTDFEARFGWALSSKSEQGKLADLGQRPQRIVCYAQIEFSSGKALTAAHSIESAFDTQVTIGNTAMEALSAHLAETLSKHGGLTDTMRQQYGIAASGASAKQSEKTVKTIIEEQLEAIQLSEDLEHRRLDVGFKFAEARHERQFTAATTGVLWRLMPQDRGEIKSVDAEATSSHPVAAQPTLPYALAHLLNDLNLKQSRYEQAAQSLETARQYLFADWHKYLSSRYPGYGESPYPDAGQIQFYLRRDVIPRLELQQTQLGMKPAEVNALLQHMVQGSRLDSFSSSQLPTVGTPAMDLLQAIEAMAVAVAKYNSGLGAKSQTDKKSGMLYQLQQAPAPRYWQPNEPVILMTGDGIQPTSRHGKDAKASKQGLTGCAIIADVFDFKNLTPSTLTALQNTIADQAKNNKGTNIGFSTWTNNPWNPFLLEWLVEFFPTVKPPKSDNTNDATNHQKLDTFKKQGYGDNYISHAYQLPVDGVDFDFQKSKTKERKTDCFLKPGDEAGSPYEYSGFSVLSDHANSTLQTTLQQWLVSAYCKSEQQQSPAPDEVADYFQTHKQAIQTWVDRVNESQYPGIKTGMAAVAELEQMTTLSQSFGSFNDALLTLGRQMQLEVADPLYETQTDLDLAQAVKGLVGENMTKSPLPFNPFCPIRSGLMQLLNLQLVDTFGQVMLVPTGGGMTVAETLQAPYGAEASVWLPPRLVQPARINFRWLAGVGSSNNELEMNDHPATSPVCGWVLPNNLTGSLMVYDSAGKGLGSLDLDGHWRPMPGVNGENLTTNSLSATEIPNPHLRRVINFVLQQEGSDFLTGFSAALNSAIENIDPESFAHHEGLALLMGRPLAVVRAMVNLEVEGGYARNQNTGSIHDEMVNWEHTTRGFEHVKFPIRIGEYGQLNDGLVGYWLEDHQGELGQVFYAPQSVGASAEKVSAEKIVTHKTDLPINLLQSVDMRPQVLTMLMDPRGKVHATSGVLPTKGIEIPKEQFAEALKAIEITFLTAPLLLDQGQYGQDQLAIPVPKEPEYGWSWLERERDEWQEKSGAVAAAESVEEELIGNESATGEPKEVPPARGFVEVSSEAVFGEEIWIREGWLKLRWQGDGEDG